MIPAASDPKQAGAVRKPVTPPLAKQENCQPSFGLGKLVILLLAAAGVLLVVHLAPTGRFFTDLQSLRDHIDGTGFHNELKFIGIVSVLMALGAPRLGFFALAGLLFGVAEGFAAAMGASILSSYTAFRLIRWCGRGWVGTRFGRNRFFRRVTNIQPTVFAVFLVRQLPVSNVFLNATLALSPVRDRAFITGSLLGFMPQGAIATLAGAGVSTKLLHHSVIQLFFATAGLAGFGLWIWRRSRRSGGTRREATADE